MTLTVELGDGFAGDEVVIVVDGREAWRCRGVATNYSVGIAESATVDVTPGSIVEVRVRGVARSRLVEGERRLRADLSPAGALTLGPPRMDDVF
ncbi:hypothetical protein LWC34_18570 [Kibdelosporangium philippinense]|uniref:TRAM domain-containing protein n=1 Tax=Kibdelosporangium philippinense TaxID=211113 RepID=A0ABS8ZG48_9PSEU|nr:hypothetical protein [Kibdelosporangium philippinense]MCE7004812.1 hypothetical protein [Kibdelosporangium philippinense]